MSESLETGRVVRRQKAFVVTVEEIRSSYSQNLIGR